VRTTAEAIAEQARSWRGARVAIENGTHSGWIGRALSASSVSSLRVLRLQPDAALPLLGTVSGTKTALPHPPVPSSEPNQPPPKTPLSRPGSPHSKQRKPTPGADRTTGCRASTPRYCLWNQNGTAPTPLCPGAAKSEWRSDGGHVPPGRASGILLIKLRHLN
jgi:hypothetical protein